MDPCFVFISHPNVAIDPALPVLRWPLSELGRARMRAGLRQPWVRDITAVHCSRERKAIDGEPISRRWDQPANGGGNWFAFTQEPRALLSRWQPIDTA